MFIGIVYFLVIVLANSVGAISGMGGGVIIKPVLDLIGAHSVASISFYSTVAVFTMSVVSTLRQLKAGVKLEWLRVILISLGAVIGGSAGNSVFEAFLQIFSNEEYVKLMQIIITVITLIFAFVYSQFGKKAYHFNSPLVFILCGFVLGFLASFLGIGGGPINVSFLMLLFSMPIKEATVYSIATIFFSQLSKLVAIGLGAGFMRFDLGMLWYVIPAAVLGGLLGAKLSQLMPAEKVTRVFQGVILVVLVINLWNGWQVIR